LDVAWKIYKESGHWYTVPDKIDDAAWFLKEKTGILVVEEVEKLLLLTSTTNWQENGQKWEEMR
jgi:hypothetical protein